MHMTDSTPLQETLTALAKECFDRSAELLMGSDLTVVEMDGGPKRTEANALRRTGEMILRARDCARGNES